MLPFNLRLNVLMVGVFIDNNILMPLLYLFSIFLTTTEYICKPI